MGEKRQPPHEQEKKFILTFGQVFLTNEEEPRKFIITDIGAGTYFYAGEISILHGQEVIHIGGTHYKENILRLDRTIWSLDRVLKAVMHLLGDTAPTGRMYDLIRKNAIKPPRTLE